MDRSDVLNSLKAGDQQTAITLIERLLAKHPDDGDLLGLLGIALEETGDLAGAEDALSRALALPGEREVRLRNASNLASLLVDSGRRDDAAALLRRVWRWPVDCAPDDNELTCLATLAGLMERLELDDETVALLSPLPGVCALGWPLLRALVKAQAKIGQLEEACRLLEAEPPPDLVEHERQALRAHVYAATGRWQEAAEARQTYLKAVPPVIIPARSSHRLSVGVIEPPPAYRRLIKPWPFAYFTNNYPEQLAQFLSDRYRMAGIFFGAGPEAIDQFKSWRVDVVINNVVNAEYLQTGDNLAGARAFAGELAAPLVNPPEAAVQCTRQKNPANLSGIDGLIVPSVRRFRRDPSRLGELIEAIEDGTPYPMIVRTPYEQESRNMRLARTRAELEHSVRELPSTQFYVIEYLGAPRERGCFRRMRCAFVGGQPIIIRADYDRQWIVRSRFIISTQIYSDYPDLLERADRIISRSHEELGAHSMAALEAVGRAIPLDVFGMDFDVDDAGNVICFEANASMGLLTPAPDEVPYPPESRQALIEALDAELTKFANPAG
jgi:tetratricopeptide (TPR) repeat protein